jgi:hypothetical protein
LNIGFLNWSSRSVSDDAVQIFADDGIIGKLNDGGEFWRSHPPLLAQLPKN